MTPERWNEIDRVWHAVLARPESERVAAVAELCAGDEALRRDVESLLGHLARASAAGFGAAAPGMPAASLAPGTRLGPYEIEASIGAGGMGEVYRARDTRLGRDVALKVLPSDFASDPDRSRRFEREARAAAALNHPPVSITTPDEARGERAHRHPSFLPDGRHFLFHTAPDGTIAIGSTDGSPPKRLVHSDSRVIYGPPDFLLYVRQNTLLAHQFDLAALSLVGDPIALVEEVRATPTLGRAVFTVSSNGVLIYRTRDEAFTDRVLTWFDRAGKALGAAKEAANYVGFELFPDGRRALAHIHDVESQKGDLWTIDFDRDTRTQVTFRPGHDFSPLVSPDGSTIMWLAGKRALYRRPSDGAGPEALFVEPPGPIEEVTDWSEHWIVVEASDSQGRPDIWYLDANDPRKAQPYLQTPFIEQNARLSRDERWIAYESQEAGRVQIYIRPFPNAEAGKWLVPGSEGGSGPRWRADGRELFYMMPNGRVMAVGIETTDRAVQIGRPQMLFEEPRLRQGGLTGWAVTRDGQRFLLPLWSEKTLSTVTPLTVVVNWTGLLPGR